MQYYELNIKVILKKDIIFKNIFEILSKFISFSLASKKEFLELHKQNSYKFYSFSAFNEIEKDGVYKKDKLYSFYLRSFNKELIEYLTSSLRENINNPYIQAITISSKKVKQFFIQEFYTLTPTIITTPNKRYWTLQESGDIMLLLKQLHENLLKKYQNFYNCKLEASQNFIAMLELKNQKPQTILLSKKSSDSKREYKLFGNKFRIIPHSDKISQDLAFFALGAGLGEKNSFGGGFCVAKGIK